MGYLIDLVGDACSCCGRGFNPAAREHPPSYSLWRVLDYALFGKVRNPLELCAELSDIRSMNGMVAGETVAILDAALARLHEPTNVSTIASLNVGDGGTHHLDAVELLVEMHNTARKFPKHRWRIV